MSEASSTCRIFVVDTFWKVVIHYSDLVAATSDRGNGALPIPPDDDSSIGQFLELRRVVRPMAGQEIVYSSSGAPEVGRGKVESRASLGNFRLLPLPPVGSLLQRCMYYTK